MKKFYNLILIILSVSFVASLLYLNNISSQLNDKENLIESLNDSLVTTVGKNKEHIAKISVIETERAKNFIVIESQDKEIKRLQNEVKRYSNEISKGGSITIADTNTKIDTIWRYTGSEQNTELLNEFNIIDSIENEWIGVTFGFINGNSIFNINKLRNEYTIAIGRERNGLFKPYKPFVELTSYNPYTRIESLRTYQVEAPKQERWGLGVNIGYGININNSNIYNGLYIGVGLSYNIITW